MSGSSLIPSATLRVLVVEDERRLRQLLLEEIPEMGFAAQGAGSAEEARRLMTAPAPAPDQPFDILMLDLQLPGMGGMEFFQHVRQRWPQMQVIILTGFGDLAAARQAIHLDVVDFLTKPCRLDEVESALDRACRRIRQRPPGAAQTDEGLSAADSASRPQPSADAMALTLAEHERQLILDALARHGGNRSAAAAELGISRRTIHYRLAEYKSQGDSTD